MYLFQCCGVSLAFGQAMGVNEAVTPPFPNSDHWYVENSLANLFIVSLHRMQITCILKTDESSIVLEFVDVLVFYTLLSREPSKEAVTVST